MTTAEGYILDLPVSDPTAECAGAVVADPRIQNAAIQETAIQETAIQNAAIQAAAVPDIASLVRLYSALLFRVAHAILRSSPEAEDVVQEVFLRVVQRREALGGIRDPRVWLVRIAWNLALDRRRAIRPDQMDEAFAATLTASSLPPDAALAEQHSLRRVLTEMERLPVKERHVLLLSAVEELSTPEIAAVLKRSESAVRSLLHRARTRLRERIEARPAKGVL